LSYGQGEGVIEHHTGILEAVNREPFGSRRVKLRAEPLEGVMVLKRAKVWTEARPSSHPYSLKCLHPSYRLPRTHFLPIRVHWRTRVMLVKPRRVIPGRVPPLAFLCLST
jgi:hypothetical protein